MTHPPGNPTDPGGGDSSSGPGRTSFMTTVMTDPTPMPVPTDPIPPTPQPSPPPVRWNRIGLPEARSLAERVGAYALLLVGAALASAAGAFLVAAGMALTI